MRTLLLFTDAFPYGSGEQFLEAEVRCLAERAPRLVIVPGRTSGERRPLPEGVEVEASLTSSRPGPARRALDAALACAGSPLFYKELGRRPSLLVRGRWLAKAAAYLGGAARVARWADTFLARTRLSTSETVWYTYWLDYQALGLALAKARHPGMTVVSRAHGWDLYAEANDPPYHPFREGVLRLLSRVYPASNYGRTYLLGRYPWAADRCEVSRLGVPDPGFDAAPSADGVLRAVSCSALAPVKRLDRLIDGLAAFARSSPEQPVEWVHFGDGPLRGELEASARAALPASVQWRFAGRVPNAEIFAFYRARPVDVFANTSASEGVPVSVMEAQSCGIPVIATAVGGTPEIVNAANGVLLEPSPSPDSIAKALGVFVSWRGDVPEKRRASKETWRAVSQAAPNYEAFARRLAELVR